MENIEDLKNIIDHFNDFSSNMESQDYIKNFSNKKDKIKKTMYLLSYKDYKSQEFTDLVLYNLISYSQNIIEINSKSYPEYKNINTLLREKENLNEKQNVIAYKIYCFINELWKKSKSKNELCQNFYKDEDTKFINADIISPVLYCLDQSYPIINYITVKSFNKLNKILNSDIKISTKIYEYLENILKIQTFVKHLNEEQLSNYNYLDLFFLWFYLYDSDILPSDEDIEDTEISSGIRRKSNEINFKKFFSNIKFESLVKDTIPLSCDPKKIKINNIISKCEQTKWVLPHFQRYFDWKKKHVRELFESIFNDYYIGSFLLWEKENNQDLGIQTIKGIDKIKNELKPECIILDGQQRMTSIYYCIKAPTFSLKGSKKPLHFYIDLHKFFGAKTKKEIIIFRENKLLREETFNTIQFPLYELENFHTWIADFEDFLVNKNIPLDQVRNIRRIIENKLRHIWQEFEVPFISLPDNIEIEQVTDIFEGINTKGKILSVFDLLIARLYKYDIELKKLWDKTLKDYPLTIKRYFNKIYKIPIYILQAISIYYEKYSACKRGDLLKIYSNIYSNSDRNFEKDWEDISFYMDKAIKYLENLRDGFGVKNVKMIPFTPVIPILTVLLKLIDTKEKKAQCYNKVKQWFWSALFTNSYSQAADSQLTIDFKELLKWFNNDESIPKTINKMKKEFSLLDFKNVQTQSNVHYKGILGLIALEGAKDFDTSKNLEFAKHNDKHHIFPKKEFSFMHGDNQYMNSILNITWMSSNTNKRIIRCKKPSIYIREFIRDKYNYDEEEFYKVLKTHFISRKAFKSLQKNKFSDFIEEREILIKNKIKELIGVE